MNIEPRVQVRATRRFEPIRVGSDHHALCGILARH